MSQNVRKRVVGRVRTISGVLISLCMLSLLAAPILAQASGTAGESLPVRNGSPRSPDTYGNVSETAYTVGAYDFNPFNSGSTYVGMGGTGDRYFTSGGGFFLAPVRIPAGAVINSIEIQGCDTSGTGITATLYSNTTVGGVESEINHGSVSTSGTPGCGFFFAAFGTPPTVDNFNRTYYAQVTHGSTDGSTRFSAVRLYYRLQISPAPAVNFFSDVPTSDFGFQFVEAFVAAGITVGCTSNPPFPPPVYCPDRNVTRREMAIFFAKALGLHFAP